ncbi:hypothetical protein TruAng_009977 [Truncatella angustata]|nr:hypothetical protein TruAng_009977 [Truncatella angustata]
MKFLNILVLAASVSAFSLDARHHKGKGGKKTANAARAIETAERAVEHVARDVIDFVARRLDLEARHHKGRAGKSTKANQGAATNSTARAIDTEANLGVRDIEARHHKGKGGNAKASKNGNGNANANNTARTVDAQERAVPVDLNLEARDIEARHHKGKGGKATKANNASKNSNVNNNATTARSVEPETEPRSAPVALDIFPRGVEARHHKGKGGKAAAANKDNGNGNAAANTTARAVDTEGNAPVDLISRAFVA